MGEDDDGEVQIGPGKRQVLLTFRCRHDAGQQVDLAFFGLFQHFAPAWSCHRFEGYTQPVADQLYVIGGKAFVVAFLIAELKGRPRGVDTKEQLRMVFEPLLFIIGERQGVGARSPNDKRQ